MHANGSGDFRIGENVSQAHCYLPTLREAGERQYDNAGGSRKLSAVAAKYPPDSYEI